MLTIALVKPYGDISIGDLVAEAGVSKQTFYELFADRDACFAAAYRHAAAMLLGPVAAVVAEAEWDRVPELAMRELLGVCERQPQCAWLFFIQGLAGASRMQAERDVAFAAFEQLANRFLDGAPADGITLDAPPVALVGAVRGLIATYLLSSQADLLCTLAGELAGWMVSYAAPASRPRWSASDHVTLPAPRLARLPQTLLPRPQRLPSKHSLPESLVTRNRRTRLIHATAQAALEHGYQRIRVADIVRSAGIAKDDFYKHFKNTADAFAATQAYAATETLTLCAEAYFTGADWVDRVWRALLMLTTLMSREPALAHVRLVEPYAAGPQAIERQQEMIDTYTIFLREGYLQAKASSRPPEIYVAAISGGIFELLRREIAAGNTGRLPCQLPTLTYIATAPFIGAEKAAARIDELAAEHRECGDHRPAGDGNQPAVPA